MRPIQLLERGISLEKLTNMGVSQGLRYGAHKEVNKVETTRIVTRVARLSDKRKVLFVSPATQHSTLLLYDASLKSIYEFPASNE